MIRHLIEFWNIPRCWQKKTIVTQRMVRGWTEKVIYFVNDICLPHNWCCYAISSHNTECNVDMISVCRNIHPPRMTYDRAIYRFDIWYFDLHDFFAHIECKFTGITLKRSMNYCYITNQDAQPCYPMWNVKNLRHRDPVTYINHYCFDNVMHILNWDQLTNLQMSARTGKSLHWLLWSLFETSQLRTLVPEAGISGRDK